MAVVAKEACDLFQPLADDKKIDLSFTAKAQCPVAGDPPMLQRLMANLIDNAIKYTPLGGIVRIGVEPDGGNCVIRVEDSGPGVPEEDQPLIFQRFFRGDQSRTLGGAGLGLSLAHAIVTAHGGSISLESAPDSNTIFWVRLPMMNSA